MIKYNRLKFLTFLSVLLFSCGQREEKINEEIKGEKELIQGRDTPIMGWSSWNNFRTNISDTLIREQADVMAMSGMKEVGYQYINIDDGYFGGRRDDGHLVSDSLKFPGGMKALASYIHSKGLKAGIYTDAGNNTCGSKFDQDKNGIGVGLYGHEEQDLNLFFNEWGYDFLKVDYCGGLWQGLDEETRYMEIGHKIDSIEDKLGKEIVYNICRWEFPGTWAIRIADSWRISADIRPDFESILHIVDTSAYLSQYASPGHFNDMDMLQVGQGMSYEEDKAHFSMWAIMASPLLAGNDLRNMSNETFEILTNEEVIAVNQDVAGIQAKKVRDYGDLELWVKSLGTKRSTIKAVAFLNRSDSVSDATVQWNDIGLNGKATVRDLWDHEEKGEFEKAYSVSIPSHGVVMLKISGTEILPQIEYEAEYAFMNLYSEENAANYEYLDEASGGVIALNIGNNPENWIEFRDIFVEEVGEYELVLNYLSEEPRDLFITINQDQELELKDLKTRGKNKFGTVKRNVHLEHGNNVIRIHNPDNWTPDIDKLSIKKYSSRNEEDIQ